MTDEELKIARAFVECSPWQWLPGMRMLHSIMGPARVRSTTDQGVWVVKEKNLASGFRVERDGNIPDVTDPATLGCILQVARDAMGDPGLHLRCTLPYVPSYTAASPWAVYSGRGQRLSDRHDSEAESLLQVLQAAPEVKP